MASRHIPPPPSCWQTRASVPHAWLSTCAARFCTALYIRVRRRAAIPNAYHAACKLQLGLMPGVTCDVRRLSGRALRERHRIEQRQRDRAERERRRGHARQEAGGVRAERGQVYRSKYARAQARKALQHACAVPPRCVWRCAHQVQGSYVTARRRPGACSAASAQAQGSFVKLAGRLPDDGAPSGRARGATRQKGGRCSTRCWTLCLAILDQQGACTASLPALH